ncbi:hypothetical protein QQX98_004452 [Neonectria punicea]|uniref:Uncharacterized protein n=1 Tax=Neonectria punicea TaxID=979145 RepID=A0ABR1HAN6_9HYPO
MAVETKVVILCHYVLATGSYSFSVIWARIVYSYQVQPAIHNYPILNNPDATSNSSLYQLLIYWKQYLGFISEWEKAMTSIVDYLISSPDVHEAYTNAMPPSIRAALDSGDRDLGKMVIEALASDDLAAAFRRDTEQGLWSFNVDSASEWMDLTKEVTLKGLEDNIQFPI